MFNLDAPYEFKANVKYELAIELFGYGSTNVSKDFSVVALAEEQGVTIEHALGLTSDHYFDGGHSALL